MQIRENLTSRTGWEVIEGSFDEDQLVVNGSNFMSGNGYLGYRGTFPEWRADRYVACVVTDTWDNADGKWKELCTVPNGLYLSISEESTGEEIGLPSSAAGSYARTLNFRYGTHERSAEFRVAGANLELSDRRFASYDNLHLVPAEMQITTDKDVLLTIRSGIDSVVWSLNGEHFSRKDPSETSSSLLVECETQEQGITVSVAHSVRLTAAGVSDVETSTEGQGIYRTQSVHLAAGESLSVITVMAVYTSRDSADPSSEARSAASNAADLAQGKGFDALLEPHKRYWDARWEEAEIFIEGDEKAQMLLRYNMYQNFIATPAHSDRLPIGARGLSCQAYQGAAFWDQEIFNLPMFLFTRPEVARNILTYRYKTLDGARTKAQRLGFQGAFYAWVSADTGEEVCPSYFFVDVLTGRPIHNHFNDWQIHVSPDVAYTVWKYYQATGDWEFLSEYGAEVVFEVMRFLASHAYYKKTKGHYEFIRLLGPDEYHENVDNNTFTNFQARYVARVTGELIELLRERAPNRLDELFAKLGIDGDELDLWADMAERIFVPEPDEETKLIEQFRGFFSLEDIEPNELAKRLQDKSEYWGWPNGIAVETQVSKQADVTQLFALHPHAYSTEVMRANYDYYEPRTQHGSSLSHSVYSMVAAWIGDLKEAYRYFMNSLS
ncbi:MAG: glycoside hydrolase family 65 protein, partial [Spirochaetales bacterium]